MLDEVEQIDGSGPLPVHLRLTLDFLTQQFTRLSHIIRAQILPARLAS